MTNPYLRKLRQVARDPVLRRWLIGRGFRQWPGEPSHHPHQPPYLTHHLPLPQEVSSVTFEKRQASIPVAATTLELAGLTVRLSPGDEKTLFSRQFQDVETLLSLHRFAWLTMAGAEPDPDWVEAIWQRWCESYSEPDESWVWHPYTAGERAINILKFVRRHGFAGAAGPFRDLLARHARNISQKLEYFGDHHTSNHLANNGRGLYLIGLWLGLPEAANMGGRILLEEAGRIFTPAGLLREGSSHYHLLLARNYDEVRRAAVNHRRPEAPALAEIADRALSHVPAFVLPGGLPLIGDISPDLPPDLCLKAVRDAANTDSPGLQADGWLRYDSGPWSGLWHASPEGWSHMPGHGHQDLGGFELHYENDPLFIDLGRGAYGEDGDAAFYRSGAAHNGIAVNDRDPYPPNRPYYDDTFRNTVGGAVPHLAQAPGSVTLAFTGQGRFAHNRTWRFGPSGFVIEDRIEGRGRHKIIRRLNTPWQPKRLADGVRLSGPRTFKITCPGAEVRILPVIRWLAYGRGQAAHQIQFVCRAGLPFTGKLQIEVDDNDG